MFGCRSKTSCSDDPAIDRRRAGPYTPALLVFGLARASSKECRRCLLTKFALAQFTGRLFWRLGNQRHLAFNIFDALSPHTVAGGYTRPIHTASHNALPLNTDLSAGHSQARGLVQCTHVKAISAPAARSSASSGISNVSRSASAKSLRLSMAHPQRLTAKPPELLEEDRRLCLSAPDDGFCSSRPATRRGFRTGAATSWRKALGPVPLPLSSPSISMSSSSLSSSSLP